VLALLDVVDALHTGGDDRVERGVLGHPAAAVEVDPVDRGRERVGHPLAVNRP
jgi:hypothetical protein